MRRSRQNSNVALIYMIMAYKSAFSFVELSSSDLVSTDEYELRSKATFAHILAFAINLKLGLRSPRLYPTVTSTACQAGVILNLVRLFPAATKTMASKHSKEIHKNRYLLVATTLAMEATTRANTTRTCGRWQLISSPSKSALYVLQLA